MCCWPNSNAGQGGPAGEVTRPTASWSSAVGLPNGGRLDQIGKHGIFINGRDRSPDTEKGMAGANRWGRQGDITSLYRLWILLIHLLRVSVAPEKGRKKYAASALARNETEANAKIHVYSLVTS